MEPTPFEIEAARFHHYTHRLVVWLALIIGGGLTALLVTEWWHFLIACVVYLLFAKWATEFFEMCVSTWWAIHGPRDDGDDDDEEPPKPPPNWPYVHTKPTVDQRV